MSAMTANIDFDWVRRKYVSVCHRLDMPVAQRTDAVEKLVHF
jgi:hypothetical protein